MVDSNLQVITEVSSDSSLFAPNSAVSIEFVNKTENTNTSTIVNTNTISNNLPELRDETQCTTEGVEGVEEFAISDVKSASEASKACVVNLSVECIYDPAQKPPQAELSTSSFTAEEFDRSLNTFKQDVLDTGSSSSVLTHY